MPYHIGERGSNGCAGYPVVDESGKVVGCHPKRAEAEDHMSALYANVPEASKVDDNNLLTYPGVGIKRPSQGQATTSGKGRSRDTTSGNVKSKYGKRPKKSRRGRSGDAKDGIGSGGIMSGGTSMGSKAETIDALEELAKQSPCWDGYVQRGMKPGGNGEMVPNCVPVKKYHEALMMMKSENGYSPTAGMKAAARRALKWKEDGKATGAGTPVGWGRATDIVAGRSLSLDTVKRMYSFFSRHEVDKKGKDFNNTSNPSNGRIMWDAWGGDAGFAWSRAIVEREKNKMDDFWNGSAFEKRNYSTRARQRMAESGEALPDGSFPIGNAKDLRNAIQSIGRASNPAQAKAHIKRRARALGMTDQLPEGW